LNQPRQGTPASASSAEELDLRGVVEGVTYRHPETLYTVLRVALEPESELPGELFGGGAARERVVHAVGKAGEVPVGGRVALRGSWQSHPKHGPQFRFRRLHELPPVGPEGIARYLASKSFRGIGPVLAKRIVETLGAETLERIDADPDCLRRVRGLKPAARRTLIDGLRAQRGERELHAFLYGLELNAGQVLEAAKTLAALGPEGAARVRANPYVLARTVRGVGFASADRAAQKLGLEQDSPERRRAALLFALEQANDEGHTCIDTERLRASTQDLLGLALEPETLAADLVALGDAGELVTAADLRPEVTLVYPPALARCEGDLAANLAALLRRGPVRPAADERALDAAERAANLRLHPDQRAAVLGCLATPVALLTGGPGVGKTTIVRLVAELAERAGISVALASPTGRAAKRLSEATGRPASTVHRLLGWDPKAHRFQHDARDPLAAGLVIVDEISMLDVVLAHHLLKAVQPPARLVLVGDPDQLPSVSAGNVLADLIRSECVPLFRLTRVFRQDAASLIVANAHRILAGEIPQPAGRDDATGDFYFFPAETDELAAERTVEVVTERIPRRFGLEWTEDVQVLAPMYRGACGVDGLNERMRRVMGGSGVEIAWRDRSWRAGDRVIQTRNDYDKQVFNGDMGRIVRVDAERMGVTVRFPEREVQYAAGELADLSCAFAITVHRSQGGEFPAVVLPLVTQHWPMLQRNLLYTAVTRAKRLVVVVGQMKALARAVANAEQGARESALAERLASQAERGGAEGRRGGRGG
jgi:exodeoxyribonuclease V alpha subunit